MAELVKRALETLAAVTNVSTGLSHPLDQSRAKELFKALHAAGEKLAYVPIKRQALENGWAERHAESLAKLADRIGKGGRVVIRNPRDWGDSAVAALKAELAGSG